MKTIFVILDGIGDRPCEQLKGKTPLESAHTPNLDWFTQQGKLGRMIPVKEDVAPESDNALASIFGYSKLFAMRGPLEAIGAGIRLQEGDLALRTNFATINNIREGKIIDRRAGRTLSTKEATILAKAINSKVRLPVRFLFKNTIQHRGVLVFRGGLSDNITNTDPAYPIKGTYNLYDTLHYSRTLDDDDENSAYSANVLNQFIEKSYSVLAYHPVNLQRVKHKLLPANIILTRDAGSSIPAIQKLDGKWAAIVYMPLEIGIAQLLGMDIFSFKYPEMKASTYENLYAGLNTAIQFSKKIIQKKLRNYDYFYLHFKETDVPGHDNKPEEKKKMIEILDRDFFSFLRQVAAKDKIKIVVTADHAVPCVLKAHSSDAVPILVYGLGKDETEHFSEKDSLRGSIGKIYGKDVMKFVKE
ncbi:phosphoglycerate mutase [Candidatus Pacearchaeota archaeon CG06_land_8_20_14_3_00_35_12]|nr:MAG: phosphoglycerate mutase [Candidatus Pacearchaeota archaeon CG06_land_8_20_14_3_00_35_12]